MTHIGEIDQSVKFENTKEDTILALANGLNHSIIIPSLVKRQCITILRTMGISSKSIYIKLFSGCLYLLLKNNIKRLNRVNIDREYPGKDGQIKDLLVSFFRRTGYNVDYQRFQFGNIGKHSPAHILALAVHRKKQKPNRVIRSAELLKLFKP